MSILVDEVFPGGAILRRDYGKRTFSLTLWHYAFREGQPIELIKVKKEAALDLAFNHWGDMLNRGYLPPQITDIGGKIWERKWKSLSLNGPDPDEVRP